MSGAYYDVAVLGVLRLKALRIDFDVNIIIRAMGRPYFLAVG